MEDFLGTWKLVESFNYDEYLKAIATEHDQNSDVISETFSEEEDQLIWEIETNKRNGKEIFTLDREFQLAAPDGRNYLITMSLKENQLVQVQKMDQIQTTIIREVQGINMIMTLNFDGIEAQRIYEKIVVPSLSKARTQAPGFPMKPPEPICVTF